jgi:hypothetical protein
LLLAVVAVALVDHKVVAVALVVYLLGMRMLYQVLLIQLPLALVELEHLLNL